MAFTTSVLLIPGEKYDTLTTSDSGFFFGIAREIDENNSMVEKYSLSHAPYGLPVGISEQGQPLITVMLYRAANSLNPSVELMDVARYWGPLLFALTLIPIFLIGKELGGDFGGCAAAFFGATLISSIYWMKVGAFDREPIQMILGAWTIYLTIRMFKTRGWAMLKFGILAGLVYGIFGLSWGGGFVYLAFVLVGGLLLVLFSERLRYLTPLLTVALLLLIYSGFAQGGSLIAQYGGINNIPWEGVRPIGEGLKYVPYIMIGGLISAGLLEYFIHRISIGSICRGILRSIRSNLSLIVSMLGIFVVATIALYALAGFHPLFWIGGTQTALGQVGGVGGTPFGRYAGEMRPPRVWQEVTSDFYGVDVLTVFIFTLIMLALAKICWSSIKRTKERWWLLIIPWLFVLAGMVWPGHPEQVGSQVRFVRLWWPFIPVLVGVGAVTLVSLLRRISSEQFGEWLKHFQKPLVFAFCASLVATPFISNAYAAAEGTTPPTEWHGVSGLDEGFMEAFGWLRENASENSIVSIQWSFGHLLTGTSERASVTDGAEVTGREGEWENQEGGIRPPDYIEDYRGYKYGVDISAIPYKVNGRRIDAQRLPTMDENEFQWIIRTYRENYDIKIDFIVFSYEEFYYAGQSYQQRYQDEVMRVLWEAENKAFASSWRGEENNIVFNFGENRENVVFDMQALNVYLRTDGDIRYLDGHALFVVDEQGNPLEYRGFWPYTNPDIQETLVININQDGNVMGARLIPSATQLIASIEIPTPMGVRVFQGNLEGINYLEVVFTSSNDLVTVSRVIHENLP